MALKTFTDLPMTATQSGLFATVSGYEPFPKPYPIRLVFRGAQDPATAGATSSGVAGYMFAVLDVPSGNYNSGISATIADGDYLPSPTAAEKDYIYGSGTLEYYYVPIKGAGCWTHATTEPYAMKTMYSGHMTITGLYAGWAMSEYSPDWYFPYDFKNWAFGHYYYFWVGAYDLAGNETTLHSGMKSASNYFYGNSGIRALTIPSGYTPDTLAPTGMYFFTP
jgi:hypothetical protein